MDQRIWINLIFCMSMDIFSVVFMSSDYMKCLSARQLYGMFMNWQLRLLAQSRHQWHSSYVTSFAKQESLAIFYVKIHFILYLWFSETFVPSYLGPFKFQPISKIILLGLVLCYISLSICLHCQLSAYAPRKAAEVDCCIPSCSALDSAPTGELGIVLEDGLDA